MFNPFKSRNGVILVLREIVELSVLCTAGTNVYHFDTSSMDILTELGSENYESVQSVGSLGVFQLLCLDVACFRSNSILEILLK
ncbi:hypothetical protein TNCV_3241211 [Trichonephila clavipes]|nr:hypothetical protein TNCV_3241211 [Trichonephila clavipes]